MVYDREYSKGKDTSSVSPHVPSAIYFFVKGLTASRKADFWHS